MDDKKFQIQVDDDDIENVLDALQNGKPFHNKDKKIGFFTHYSVLRCAYFAKLEKGQPTKVEQQKVDLPHTEPTPQNEERSSGPVEIPQGQNEPKPSESATVAV